MQQAQRLAAPAHPPWCGPTPFPPVVAKTRVRNPTWRASLTDCRSRAGPRGKAQRSADCRGGPRSRTLHPALLAQPLPASPQAHLAEAEQGEEGATQGHSHADLGRRPAVGGACEEAGGCSDRHGARPCLAERGSNTATLHSAGGTGGEAPVRRTQAAPQAPTPVPTSHGIFARQAGNGLQVGLGCHYHNQAAHDLRGQHRKPENHQFAKPAQGGLAGTSLVASRRGELRAPQAECNAGWQRSLACAIPITNKVALTLWPGQGRDRDSGLGSGHWQPRGAPRSAFGQPRFADTARRRPAPGQLPQASHIMLRICCTASSPSPLASPARAMMSWRRGGQGACCRQAIRWTALPPQWQRRGSSWLRRPATTRHAHAGLRRRTSAQARRDRIAAPHKLTTTVSCCPRGTKLDSQPWK